MARDGRLGEIELADDVADATLLVFQQPEYVLPGRVGQRLEDLRHVTGAPVARLEAAQGAAEAYRPMFCLLVHDQGSPGNEESWTLCHNFLPKWDFRHSNRAGRARRGPGGGAPGACG